MKAGKYAALKLTDKGRLVLNGLEQPLLPEPARKKAAVRVPVARNSRGARGPRPL